MEYDYWLDWEEADFAEPSDDPPEGAEVEHCGTVTLEELDELFADEPEDRGWRQSDFV